MVKLGKALKGAGKVLKKGARKTGRAVDKAASKVEKTGFLDRLLSAMEYYDAHDSLPPTFDASSYGLSTMPDHVDKKRVREALQRAHDAEMARKR
jgi:hypothetical protein